MLPNSLMSQEYVELCLKFQPFTQAEVEQGAVPFLTADVAAFRAGLVARVAKQLRLDWPILNIPLPHPIVSWTPVYEIPGSGFGKSDDDTADECHRAHGVGLNWGGLHRFARACEIGFRLFPKTFPTAFTTKLRTPTQHIDTVEEICWLDVWHGLEVKGREIKFAGAKKSIDWRLTSCGLPINLEIKFRRDWMRRVDGPESNVVKEGYYKDVHLKFPSSNPGELNLIGVSSYCEPDQSWRDETRKLISSSLNIDGVVMWCPSASSDIGPFTVIAKEAPLVRSLISSKLEDNQHLVVIRHLWRNGEERREARVEEVIKHLQKQNPHDSQ